MGGQWAGGGGGGGAIVLTAAGAQLNTQGFHGSGGSGGGGGVSGAGGGGGVAVVLTQGGIVTNASGSQLTGGDAATAAYGGGGGGGVFLVSGGTLLNNAAILGGAGGGSSTSVSGGTGGHAAQANRGLIDNMGTLFGGVGGAAYFGGIGGHGVLANATDVRNAAGATIAGGVGGANIFSQPAYSTGSGGDGVRFITGQGSLDNAGSINGGNTGGITGASADGAGGVGVRAQSDGNTLINSGAISGGLNNGGARGNAVSLEGNNNTLELRAGYSFTGNVVATGTGNILRLGGAADATLNLATGLQYQGFASFDKIGATTWTVSGTGNTSHVWNINAGTLTGDSTSLQGVLHNGAAVVFDQATNGSYAGAMDGVGTLTKTGAGTLTLSGGNSYSGGTTVSGGMLTGTTTSLQGSITNNAAVTFDQHTNGAYAGAMSGTGSLTKTGAGVVQLSGTNTYGGATVINGGTLEALGTSSLSATSAVTMAVGGTLSVKAANSIGSLAGTGLVSLDANLTTGGDNTSTTFTGTINSTGGLIKTGTGTLTLAGGSMYTGGTTVNAGTLQGNASSLQGSITNNAAVNFDQATTGTYAGVMSGTGSFAKLGAGNLILTGVNTYNGATSVNAGTLSVNGSISNSAVTVNNGGVLGGSGTVGSTSIASGGVLAPGNSIGTLTVNGNLSFAVGSIYRVEVDAAGANDRITATGTATINGGTVDVQAGAGTYQASTQYTILNAVGGRTGNFAGVTSNLAFLTPTLGYDANNVFLTLARNEVTFASVAVTPNQIATSTALQNAGNTGDMGAVQTALTGLSAAQARAVYDSTSGSGIVALRRAGAGFAAGFGSQLQARLGAQANAASGFANSFTSRPVLLAANDHLSDLMAPVSDSAPQKFSLAGGGASLSSSPDAASKGFWVRGNGGYGNTDADGNAAASRLRSSGLSVGFDAEVKDGARIGVAATGGTSRLTTDNNETGKTRGTVVAVYGSYANGPWNFSGSASLGWGKNHLDRNVVIGGLNRVAASDFDSSTLAAYGEASYSIPMNGWTLQPLAGLALSRNKADGFTETGAGALNLQVAEQTINSSKAMLGAKAFFGTGRIRFEPRVIWAHEFGDLNTPMTAQFQGAATASPFQVSGATLKRDTLVLGLGASGSISKGLDLFADVQAELNAAQRNLAVLVGLRSRW